MVCLFHPIIGAEELNISKRQKPFIGMRYMELPKGYRHLMGTMLEDKRYGVTVVERGTEKMAWLGRVVGYRKDGKAEWEVLDILVLPPLQGGQELADICNNEIRGRKYTMTIATFNDAIGDRKTIKIHHAWQVDLQLKKFDRIPSRGIECIDPGEE
jgi:hypothetical protein